MSPSSYVWSEEEEVRFDIIQLTMLVITSQCTQYLQLRKEKDTILYYLLVTKPINGRRGKVGKLGGYNLSVSTNNQKDSEA